MPAKKAAGRTPQPYAAIEAGIFAPSVGADEEREVLQNWLSQQHTLFLSLARIHQEALNEKRREAERLNWKREESYLEDDLEAEGPLSSHLPYYARLLTLVIQSNRDVVAELADLDSASYIPHVSQQILPALTLFQTIYLSPNATDLQHGGEGLVGEELLHWLNSFDLAPTTEQGREIASSSEPYLHPSYWDYILRCTLRGFHSTVSTLLATLLSLPSPALNALITRIRELIKDVPRSMDFKTESQFKAARRGFHLKLLGILSSLEGVLDDVQDQLTEAKLEEDGVEEADAEEEAEDMRLGLEAGLRVFLEVLAGNKDRVVEAAEDWREALAAWGTLVDVGLKRDGLPDALAKIHSLRGEDIEGAAVGPSVEGLMIRLIKGEVSQACEAAFKLDPYLAQVMTDLSTKLAILPVSPDSDSATKGPTLLERANLTYANTLLTVFGFWRMALDYLWHAELRGKARISQVILGLPLLEDPEQLNALKQATKIGDQMEDGTPADAEPDEFHLVESILEACSTFGLQRESKAICRKIALHLCPSAAVDTTPLRFGPAVVYALRTPPRPDLTVLRLIKRRALEGLLSRRSRGTSSAETWFIQQVEDVKRWIIKAQRSEAERAAEESLKGGQASTTAGPFLNKNRRPLELGKVKLEEAEEMLLNDEDEWNHHFLHLLPGPILLLTKLSHFFALRKKGETLLATALLIELLNLNITDGDWIGILLVEVGYSLDALGLSSSPPQQSRLDPGLFYDLLRMLEALTSHVASCAASLQEQEFHLGKLEEWIAAASSKGSRKQSKQEDARPTFNLAQAELRKLRWKIAKALSLSGNGSSSGDSQIIVNENDQPTGQEAAPEGWQDIDHAEAGDVDDTMR